MEIIFIIEMAFLSKGSLCSSRYGLLLICYTACLLRFVFILPPLLPAEVICFAGFAYVHLTRAWLRIS